MNAEEILAIVEAGDDIKKLVNSLLDKHGGDIETLFSRIVQGSARVTRDYYMELKYAGFTDEQAFQLALNFKQTLGDALKNSKRNES